MATTDGSASGTGRSEAAGVAGGEGSGNGDVSAAGGGSAAGTLATALGAGTLATVLGAGNLDALGGAIDGAAGGTVLGDGLASTLSGGGAGVAVRIGSSRGAAVTTVATGFRANGRTSTDGVSSAGVRFATFGDDRWIEALSTRGAVAAVATGRVPGINLPHHAPATAAMRMATRSDAADA